MSQLTRALLLLTFSLILLGANLFAQDPTTKSTVLFLFGMTVGAFLQLLQTPNE